MARLIRKDWLTFYSTEEDRSLDFSASALKTSSPQVIVELKRHRKANPITTWVFKEALEDTGVEWHGLRAFRRGLAARLLNNKTDLPTVGRILRHTPGSEVTLKHYVEVQEDMQADALKNLTKSKK